MIARFLGYHPPFLLFLGIQVIQVLIVFFGFTPGSAGLAEIITLWLVSPIISKKDLLIFTLAWRFLSSYTGGILGTWVVLSELRRPRQYKHHKSSK